MLPSLRKVISLSVCKRDRWWRAACEIPCVWRIFVSVWIMLPWFLISSDNSPKSLNHHKHFHQSERSRNARTPKETSRLQTSQNQNDLQTYTSCCIRLISEVRIQNHIIFAQVHVLELQNVCVWGGTKKTRTLPCLSFNEWRVYIYLLKTKIGIVNLKDLISAFVCMLSDLKQILIKYFLCNFPLGINKWIYLRSATLFLFMLWVLTSLAELSHYL